MQGFPIGLDVAWQRADSITGVNHYLHNWLVDTGSLTERIQSMCRHFSVQIIGQGMTSLHQNEQALLPLSEQHYHVREVLLLADNVPWVFARSVIPTLLTQGEWQNMGNSPLGKRLFNDKRFVRGEFEIGTVDAQHFTQLIGHSHKINTLYGRRSAFHFASQDILIAEVFLPESPVYQGVVE